MAYEAHENHPHGWEVSDMNATPIRTFVVGLSKEQATQVAAELNAVRSRRNTERKIFPRRGIYRVSNLPSSHFMTPEDERRFNCVRPAREDMEDWVAKQCWLADCWIVDKDGNTNPGTSNCPVPAHLKNIGRKVGD